MTIQREHHDGPFVVQCDTCSETEELEGTEFAQAVADSRERGFRPVKCASGWLHECRGCQ